MEEKVKSLFIAYLEKQISEQDELILIHYIKENPDLLKEWIEIKRLWKISGSAEKFDDQVIENEWNLLQTRIRKSAPENEKQKNTLHFWLPKVAAAFILGAVITVAVLLSLTDVFNEELVYTEISTPRGANSKLTLPDGSVVFLNAGSSLKYSNQYGRKRRDVYLIGEAFFDVTSDKSKIFVVQAADLFVRAYGTSFNVKSYPEEQTVEATLIEGSIGVIRIDMEKSKTDEVMLKPNQRVVYYKKSQQTNIVGNKPDYLEEKVQEKNEETGKLTYLISKGIDTKPFTSWKEGILVINSETLESLAIKLERKYDMNIHFESEELKKMKFTGTIENETIEQVMEAISIAAHIDYSIKDRDIWLNYQKLN